MKSKIEKQIWINIRKMEDPYINQLSHLICCAICQWQVPNFIKKKGF